MNLELIRYDGGAHDTLGKLHINGQFACYTLEDEYREVKVRKETRIPAGQYRITFRKVGGFHQRYSSRFPDIHRGMLWIRDIPNFEYVLIHTGNTEDHTAGCILVGKSTGTLGGKRAVLSSTAAYKQVYPVIARALETGETVTLHVIDRDREPNTQMESPETPASSRALTGTANRGYYWIIDNGHGQNTPGKRSPVRPDGKQLLEYEFNRAVVDLLVDKLKNAGIACCKLVTEIFDVPLSTRVNRANSMSASKPKRLVSVHGNAAGSGDWHSASGLETFHYPTSTNGKKLADVFQSHLFSTLKWRNRGVKSANFYILRRTSMPAILTENGFFTNFNECGKMLDAQCRDQIAEAHFQAIHEVERSA